MKTLSLREGTFPVDSPIETESPSTVFEFELPFADSVNQFKACECHGRSDKRLETLQRSALRFDPAMVLFDNVVEVLAGAHAHVAPLDAFSAQLPERGSTRHMAIECDRAREPLPIRVERLAKESLGSGNSEMSP